MSTQITNSQLEAIIDFNMGNIAETGLLRVSSFARLIRGSGHVSGIYPQTAGDLGFAMQFNAETPWHLAQLRYPQVGLL